MSEYIGCTRGKEMRKFNKKIAINQVAPLKSRIKNLEFEIKEKDKRIQSLLWRLSESNHKVNILQRDLKIEKEGAKQ